MSGGPLGVTWRNHTIAFGRGAAGIEALPDTGGEARTIASVDAKTERAVQPDLLDGGQYVVFGVPTPLDTGRESATGEGPIVVQPLAGGARKVLVPVGANPRVLSSGQLVYLHDRTIFGIPFDARRVEVTGDPVALVENVTQTGASSAGQFGVSQTGSLVYVTAGSMDPQRSLVWVDRQGQEQTLPAAANSYQQPRISPDGGRFVVSDSANIWIWSFASETLMRLTNDAAVHYNPAWTPDGRRVVYDSSDGRGTQILRKAADGTGVADVVAPAPAGFPEIVSPDEKYLVYHRGERISMLLPTNPRGPARRLLPDVKGQVSDAEISRERALDCVRVGRIWTLRHLRSAVSRRGHRALADLIQRRHAPTLVAQRARAVLHRGRWDDDVGSNPAGFGLRARETGRAVPRGSGPTSTSLATTTSRPTANASCSSRPAPAPGSR